MIRYVTLFFGYCLSLKLTSSTVWFRDFTRRFTKKNKREQNVNNLNQATTEETTNDEEQQKQNLKKILNLLEEEPSENEVKLSRSKRNFTALLPGGGLFLMLICATITITIKPFTSDNIYIWNYLSFIFLFIVWNNFKTCTQVPIYILIFIAREKLCRLFPFRLSSRLFGRICDITIPRRFRSTIYTAYIKTYGVNIEEADIQDLKFYKSLNSFFRRSIKSQLRPISHQADIVSPCDGTIVYHGQIHDGIVRQVKGMCFSLRELFATNQQLPEHSDDEGTDDHHNIDYETDTEYARSLMKDPINNQLNACVIYLAPGDYHRFHSPADCNVLQRKHIAGELISVKPKLLEWLPHLFAINERIVLEGNYQDGKFLSTIAVGATNVGSIVIYNDPELKTNLWENSFTPRCEDHLNFHDFVLDKGDSLGEFRFGSTLVVIYEAPRTNIKEAKVGEHIKYGEALSSPAMTS